MARIIFLGTAGDDATLTKQLRASGGIIAQLGDLQLHLDPGPGSLVRAREFGVNLHYTTALLVSSNKIKALNDLNANVAAMTHSGIEHRGVILAPKSVLKPAQDHSCYLLDEQRKMVEKVTVVEKQHKFAVDLIEIHALPIINDDEHAVGYRLFGPRFNLSYLPDTYYSEEIIDDLKGSDILILSVQYPQAKAKGKTLDTQGAIKIISAIRPKLAIITGFGLEMLKAGPLEEAREIQRITGVQTIAAHDGLSIVPGSYSVRKSPVRGYD